jgi:hypothetical protein
VQVPLLHVGVAPEHSWFDVHATHAPPTQCGVAPEQAALPPQVQVPPVQVSASLPQAAHVDPPAPQATALGPARQYDPLQHPFGQVEALQG